MKQKFWKKTVLQNDTCRDALKAEYKLCIAFLAQIFILLIPSKACFKIQEAAYSDLERCAYMKYANNS